MPIKREDVLVDGSDWKLDLCKLVGKQIKTVTGYVSHEFDDPVFKVCEIIFDDDSLVHVEGEHDLPYLVVYGLHQQPNLDDETLTALSEEN